MEIKFTWEVVRYVEDILEDGIIIWESTERAKVPGGWLIKDENYTPESGLASNMCFIADKKHEWQIKHEEKTDKSIKT
jgi:hypothetical protein